MTNPPIQYAFPMPKERLVKIDGQMIPIVEPQSLRDSLFSIHSRVNVITGAAPNGMTFKGPLNTGGHIINGGVQSKNPTPDEFVTIGHIQGNYKAQSVSTGIVGASGTKAVALTWTTPFPDANYIPQAQVQDKTTTTAGLAVHHIQSVTASQVIVVVQNTDATNPHSGTVFVTAQHS